MFMEVDSRVVEAHGLSIEELGRDRLEAFRRLGAVVEELPPGGYIDFGVVKIGTRGAA